jgi:hypothetical protein
MMALQPGLAERLGSELIIRLRQVRLLYPGLPTKGARSVLAQKISDFLNELLISDPEAVKAMTANRVRCNEQTAEHPTIQVGLESDDPEDPRYSLGIVGLLNGVIQSCGGEDTHRLAQILDTNTGELLEFVAREASEFN